MITAVLTALTLTAAPAEAPTDAELVLVRVEPTRLVARNLGQEDRLLLFAADGRSEVVGHRLSPGATLRLDFPRHALDGVSLEVVDAFGPEWSTTGALSLTPDATDRAWSLFCSPPTASAQQHGLANSTREVLDPARSLMPRKALQFFQQETVSTLESAHPTHVPGPKPGPPKPGDTPPDLEKDPLPPL